MFRKYSRKKEVKNKMDFDSKFDISDYNRDWESEFEDEMQETVTAMTESNGTYGFIDFEMAA